MKPAWSWAFWLLVATLLLAAVLPSATLAMLRSDWHWFGTMMNRIEAIPLPLDTTHALLFAAIAAVLAMRLRMHGSAALSVLGVCAGLSTGTELLQVLAPGRHPEWLDVRDDMIGATAGLLLVYLLRALLGHRHDDGDRGADAATATVLALLRGQAPQAWPEDAQSVQAVLDCARRQRVEALLLRQIDRLDGTAARPLRIGLSAAVVNATARALVRASEARRIGQCLHAQGIDHLWLKGAALSTWLYPSAHLRDCADIDVLFETRAAANRAVDALAALGYACPARHIAGDLYVHELLARSDHLGLELDLHWRLSNNALFADRLAWPELRADAQALSALSDGALGLSPVHAFMHACMHWAGNRLLPQSNTLHWLYDLHLLALRFTADEWQQVRGLAQSRRLSGTCLAALDETSSVFGSEIPDDVRIALSGQARSERLRPALLRHWWYFQYATMCELPTWRMRGRWLRQMLIGDRAHLRERYGADGAGDGRVLMRRVIDGVRRLWGYATR